MLRSGLYEQIISQFPVQGTGFLFRYQMTALTETFKRLL